MNPQLIPMILFMLLMSYGALLLLIDSERKHNTKSKAWHGSYLITYFLKEQD